MVLSASRTLFALLQAIYTAAPPPLPAPRYYAVLLLSAVAPFPLADRQDILLFEH